MTNRLYGTWEMDRASQPVWNFLPCPSFLLMGCHLEKAGIRHQASVYFRDALKEPGLSLRASRVARLNLQQAYSVGGSEHHTQGLLLPRAVWARVPDLRNLGHA